MQVSVYTRHSKTCPKRDDTNWKRCRCPKWHYCSEWKPQVQRSAKTRSWDEAESRARKLEQGEAPVVEKHGTSIAEAVKAYQHDIKDRALSLNYQCKIKRELGELEDWCANRSIRFLDKLTLAHLGEHRRDWTGSPRTRSKRQERLRSFFLYCRRHKWIVESPAEGLSRIKVPRTQVMPLTQDQFRGCLDNCPTERTRAMVLLLRWSGLRISDAARLERNRVNDGKLFLYTHKTGTPVNIALPQDVLDALGKVENDNPRYFFWSGTSAVTTPGVRWWENLKAVFKKAGIPNAHPHIFRHTFAVELLLAGVPMDQVSLLLGHSSIKVTEGHYAAFSKARQEQLEESVKKSWQVR